MNRLFKTSDFEEDLDFFRRHNRKLFEKVKTLVVDILEHPSGGHGKPERLRCAEFGVTLYSRRIDKKNRLIYKVESVNSSDSDIVLLNCKGHYGDK